MNDRYTRIIEIVVEHLPLDVLREFLIELDRFDTESKQEILQYREINK
jgi:hypothetical protein